MNEFDYGDPHPLAINLRKRKHEADQRAGRKFVEVLSTADTLYLQDADGVREGLALFDREATNIRHWQAYMVRTFTANPDDTVAAEMCRDYALTGIHPASLRLHAIERLRWQEECVVACRRLGDRQGEACAMGNVRGTHFLVGDVLKAIGFHEQQLAIAREIGDRSSEQNALGSNSRGRVFPCCE